MRFIYGILIVFALVMCTANAVSALEIFGQRFVFKGEKFIIEIKDAEVHTTPEMTSPVISKLHFGDEIEIAEDKNSWIRFEKDGVSGWVHMSSGRTNYDIKENQSKQQVGLDERNLALATKGYGENQNKDKRISIQFSKKDLNNLNSMLKYSYSREQLFNFYNEGK